MNLWTQDFGHTNARKMFRRRSRGLLLLKVLRMFSLLFMPRGYQGISLVFENQNSQCYKRVMITIFSSFILFSLANN